MTGETLLTFLSCYFLSHVSGSVIKIANTGFLDNVGAAALSRLYRNVPIGVYANSAPYGAFSFQVPTYVSPKTNQVVPYKEENVMLQNTNGFLRDSYGNKFQDTRGYKITIPQQFVQLQSLPAHLSQPLGSSQNFQFKQVTPHFFPTPQYTFSNVQGFSAAQPQYMMPHPVVLPSNVKNVSPPTSHTSRPPEQLTTQQQTSVKQDVYVENESTHKPSTLIQQELSTPGFSQDSEQKAIQSQQSVKKEKIQKEHSLNKEMSITTYVNGKKTVVNIETKPPLPLLDLSLLKPLTFDNPLVPQLQHFLPPINDATYHDLPETKPKFTKAKVRHTDASKKKLKKPRPQIDDNKVDVQTTSTVQKNASPDDSPEFSYDVSSPSYKETYTEHKVSYNKATEPEPVQINYGKQTQNKPIVSNYEKHVEDKPVQYTYVHDFKEPIQIKKTYYQSHDDDAKHIVYRITSAEESDKNKEERHVPTHKHNTESDKELSIGLQSQKPYVVKETRTQYDIPLYINNESRNNNIKTEQGGKTFIIPNDGNKHNGGKVEYIYLNAPFKHEEQNFQRTNGEYEKGISIVGKDIPHILHHTTDQNSYGISNNKQSLQSPKIYKSYYSLQSTQYPSVPITREEPKRILIKEEFPNEDINNEKVLELLIKQDENEENFEKTYKNAAYGFPGYDSRFVDEEKGIYNPETYGASKYHNEYDIENTPLRQYQAQGDRFPHETRANYKDSREKIKEGYFLDYSVSKPESNVDKFTKKKDYLESFKNFKHQKHLGNGDNNRKSAHSVESTFISAKNKHNAKSKERPYLHAYDYSKEAPRKDNSGPGAHPYQRHKSKTQFVEPQYQYGFEPISLPRLLDSELAAMASNAHVNSETPATRSKVYKENYYIKKTTSGTLAR